MTSIIDVKDEILAHTIYCFSDENEWMGEEFHRRELRLQELACVYEWEIVYDWTLERKLKQHGSFQEVVSLKGMHTFYPFHKKAEKMYHEKTNWFATENYGKIYGKAKISIQNLRIKNLPPKETEVK